MRALDAKTVLDDMTGKYDAYVLVEDRGLADTITTAADMIEASGGTEAWLTRFAVEIRAQLVKKAISSKNKIRDCYTGTCFVEYDADGNVTGVAFNTHAFAGTVLQKNITFEPAFNVMLYPDKYVVMLDESNQPELYERGL